MSLGSGDSAKVTNALPGFKAGKKLDPQVSQHELSKWA